MSRPARSKPPTKSVKPARARFFGVSGESKLSIQILRGLVEAVEQAGIPRIRLLRAARLEPAQLDSAETSVPRSEIYRLCELALDLTQDPALGLHWGERLSENTFNPISHLVAHAATLRQAFESLSQFHRLLNDQPSFQLLERDDKVTVRCLSLTGAGLRVQRFAAEMLVAGCFRIMRSFRAGARPERVSFEYPAPAYHSEYSRVFELSEHFEQPFTGIVFDRALMDTPSPHKDEDVHDALRVIAERRILRLTRRVPWALRVRELLVRQGGARRTDMKAVAKSLGVSTRSLRRRLMTEGKSYNAILHEALAIVASQFLWDKRLTIQETAYEMGFADTCTFHRAFKRWTGMTPNAFREAQLATTAKPDANSLGLKATAPTLRDGRFDVALAERSGRERRVGADADRKH